MAGDDEGFAGQGEQAFVDAVEKLVAIAAGKVRAAYAASEKGISGDEEIGCRDVKAEAAFGVAGGEEDSAFDAVDGEGFVVGGRVVGRMDVADGEIEANPGGLPIHDGDEREVFFVIDDGGAGDLFESLGAGDVVEVGVGDDDLLDGELVLGEDGEDAADVVAGVDDDSFVGGFVAEDGAIALEEADGEGFADHGSSSKQKRRR